MYVAKLIIECHDDVELNVAQPLITQLLDEYRYNGQIIGREFPLILDQHQFCIDIVCPSEDSLAAEHNTGLINQLIERLNNHGLRISELQWQGIECQSDFTDNCSPSDGYIIYSTFVQSCSPIRCLSHFAPVPLFELPEQVRKPLIKWQENQAACDQLQMNQCGTLENKMVFQLSELDSDLTQQGRLIANQIKQATGKPVYYYLYRVTDNSLEEERRRVCPSCQSPWLLTEPMFELFDFCCQKCGLVSNISWQSQG